MDISVVTCVTGNFNKVHETNIKNAYVVSTLSSSLFIEHCKSMGWSYIGINEPHTNDLFEATRQSKFAKSLKYFKPNTKYVLYIDHKYKIQQEHLAPLIQTIGDEAFLSFRNPKDVYKEFYDSMAYARYRNTLKEIRRNVQEAGDLSNLELFYGGLILYNTHHEDFKSITNKMNESVYRYNHAQDQFLFPIALKDQRKILIDNTIGLKHECPQTQIEGITY